MEKGRLKMTEDKLLPIKRLCKKYATLINSHVHISDGSHAIMEYDITEACMELFESDAWDYLAEGRMLAEDKEQKAADAYNEGNI